MLRLAGAAALLVTTAASLQANSNGGRAYPVSMGFFKPNELASAPAHLDNAVGSVAKLFNGNIVDSCSGGFVSRSGYFLTAAHCLPHCFEPMPDPELRQLLYLQRPDAANRVDCAEHVWINERKATEVIIGRGILEWDGNPDSPVSPDGERRIIERQKALSGGDWAIVKIEGGSQRCLPINPEFRAGAEVWSAGYPGDVRRKEGSSDGVSLRFVQGRIFDSVAAVPRFAASPEERDLMMATLEDAVQSGAVIVTDTDGFHGLSGGPYLNSSGELIGVITNSAFDSARDIRRPSMSGGTSIRHIRDSLASQGFDLSQIFDCPAAR